MEFERIAGDEASARRSVAQALDLLKVSLMKLENSSSVTVLGVHCLLTSGDGLSGVFWKRGVLSLRLLCQLALTWQLLGTL